MKTAALMSFIIALFLQQPPAGMVSIPGGEFWMGRTHYFLIDEVGWLERDRRDDMPAHKISIDAFYLDKYEVTNEEYARFSETVRKPKLWYWRDGKIAKGEEKHPVHDVTWYEADAYCKTAGKRLPTEAEFERAIRGGLDRKKFAWGDGGVGLGGNDPDAAPGGPAERTKQAHVGFPWGTAEVGTYPPNAYGVFDMVGNVWEWTNDWYDRDYYPVSPDRNPPGPAAGAYKVIRGGGWSDDDERNFMNHYRNFADPLVRTYTVGFRCAMSQK